MSTVRRVLVATSLPLALAMTPAARWGHQAVFVPSQQAMYVVGGEVAESGSQITNEVLVLSLNSTNPSFTAGPNDALPPHAFAAAALSRDGGSLMVIGGMTSQCASDSLTHTLDLSGSDSTWHHATPAQTIRKRGAAAAWVDDGSDDGKVMVIGGVADKFVCSTTTYTYPASDVLSIPMGSNALVSTRNLPPFLTGTDLAVSEFALTSASDGTLFLVGGESASGNLVSLDTVGKWTNSSGWKSQETSGDVPAGRVGASLVAHPHLDLLILHGGSVASENGAEAPTNLVAFLNTTSWEWSTPTNLQPSPSAAAAYHSSIMTTSGVMITAFGLGSTGSPRPDVFYLDMRDPSTSTWSWKSNWTAEMLTGPIPDTSVSTKPSNVGVESTQQGPSTPKSSMKRVVIIAVPVVLGLLIVFPLAIYFLRRQVRLSRTRRLARHFSFSSQEDSGDFRRRSINAIPSMRRTKTQYGFGKDANEKEGSVLKDVIGALKQISNGRSAEDRSTQGDGSDMWPSSRSFRVIRSSGKAMKWEEIDFGLGRIDEKALGSGGSRHGLFSAHGNIASGVASTSIDAFAIPPQTRASLDGETNSLRVGTPTHDGQAPLVPALHLVTPDPTSSFNPSIGDGLDWNMLAEEMQNRPAFRSISPNSTLRSHAHIISGEVAPLPTRLSNPLLPPFDYPRHSSSAMVNPVTGLRVSENALPYTRIPTPRFVSSPVTIGRELASGPGRRGCSPRHKSGSGSITPTSHVGDVTRRASNSLIYFPEPFSIGSTRRASTTSQLRVINADADIESSSSEGSGGE